MDNIYPQWLIGLGIAAAIVLIAALLLIMVWLAARRILRLARTALQTATAIKANTQSIWGLQQTNEVAGDILKEAEAIEGHTQLVAKALKEVR